MNIECLGRIFASLALLAITAVARADGSGRLPRGAAEVVPGKVTPPVRGATSSTHDGTSAGPAAKVRCGADLATPLGAEGYFTNDGALFYHISRVKSVAASPGDLRKRYRYNIHQVDMTTRVAEVLAATDLPEVDAIVPHGNPARGITAIIWQADAIPCHSGEANYVTFSLDPTMPSKTGEKVLIPKAVQDQGPVAVVETATSQALYNIKRRALLELDFGLFQTRHTLLSTPGTERPLYAEATKRTQYTWRVQKTASGEQRGLVAYKNGDDAAAKLQFKGEDRLLQQGKLFGVSQYDFASNSIKIMELSKWSGQSTSGDFVVTLPGTFPIREAEIKVNFPKREILVAGMGESAKRNWRRVFIYDYQNGWEVGPFKPKNGSYVSYADIDPTGKYAVTAVSNSETGLLEQILLFSFNTRKWLQVAIPQPR